MKDNSLNDAEFESNLRGFVTETLEDSKLEERMAAIEPDAQWQQPDHDAKAEKLLDCTSAVAATTGSSRVDAPCSHTVPSRTG